MQSVTRCVYSPGMAAAKKPTRKTAIETSIAKTNGKSPSKTTEKKARTKKAMTKKTGSKKDTAKKAPTKKALAATKKAPAATKKAPAAAKKAPAKKAAAAKKDAAKKAAAAKKDAAKKAAAAKKDAAKKAAAAKKDAAKKAAAAKKDAAKSSVSARKSGKNAPPKKRRKREAITHQVDPTLFAPLTSGERAEALRLLLEDPRLSTMANVGRYRVITVEPLAVKPPHGLAGRRLARLVIYDYAADRSVDGCIDLDKNRVTHLNVTRAQPMLAREEEAAAIGIALADERVKEQLALGEEPRVAMHYWSTRDTNLSYSRRSAAVIFGRADGDPSIVAVVDLLDDLVTEIVPATQW